MTDNPGRQSGEHEAVALAGTVRDRDGRAIESIPQPGIARFPMTAFCRQCSQPVRASARPSSMAPVCSVIEAKARMFPFTTEIVPRVAELPTCQ